MTKQKYLNSLEDIRLTKEFVFLNPYHFITYFIIGIIAAIVAVCIFLGFTNKQETIDTSGVLQLSDKVQDLQVLTDGIVNEGFVKDGEYVEKGTLLFSLKSDKLTIQKEEYEKQIAQTQTQIDYLKRLEECINNRTNTFQNNEEEGYYYAQAENFLTKLRALGYNTGAKTTAALTTQRQEYQELLSAMENLTDLSDAHALRTYQRVYKDQITSYDTAISQAQAAAEQMAAAGQATAAAQYQQQVNSYTAEKENYKNQQLLSVQQQITSLNQQIAQAQSTQSETADKSQSEIEQLTASSLVELQNQKQQLQTKLDEYKANLSGTEADLSLTNIEAKDSGYLFYKGDIKKDTALSSGSLVGIITKDKSQAQAFKVTLSVPSSGIGFVKLGQNVKLSVNGLSTSEYGYINGTVTKIYETPVQSENALFYYVEATVDFTENSSIYKELFALKDNMSITANIVTKETSWLTYLMQKINILKDEEKTGNNQQSTSSSK